MKLVGGGGGEGGSTSCIDLTHIADGQDLCETHFFDKMYPSMEFRK